MSNRPLGVSIVGYLNLLQGILAFAVVLIGGLGIGGATGINAGGTAAVVIAGVLAGIIPFIIGYGMLKGWSIMWWLGIIFNVIYLIGGIITFLFGGFITVIISAIILWYLTKKNVREFFGH